MTNIPIEASFVANLDFHDTFEVPAEVVAKGEAAVAAYIKKTLDDVGSSQFNCVGETIEIDGIVPNMPKRKKVA